MNGNDLSVISHITKEFQAFVAQGLFDTLGQGEGEIGGILQPPPAGLWRMPRDQIAKLYGLDVHKNRQEARALMRKLGYGPDNRLKIKVNRRSEHAEQRKSHVAELRKRVTEADAKLKRLYDAIEKGIADLSDSLLKDRVSELKATRDQARLDTDRAQDAIERVGPTLTPQILKRFARTARERMRTDSGGYRREGAALMQPQPAECNGALHPGKKVVARVPPPAARNGAFIDALDVKCGYPALLNAARDLDQLARGDIRIGEGASSDQTSCGDPAYASAVGPTGDRNAISAMGHKRTLAAHALPM